MLAHATGCTYGANTHTWLLLACPTFRTSHTRWLGVGDGPIWPSSQRPDYCSFQPASGVLHRGEPSQAARVCTCSRTLPVAPTAPTHILGCSWRAQRFARRTQDGWALGTGLYGRHLSGLITVVFNRPVVYYIVASLLRLPVFAHARARYRLHLRRQHTYLVALGVPNVSHVAHKMVGRWERAYMAVISAA